MTLAISTTLFCNELIFYKEVITITVWGDYCELDGDYFFKNDDNISTIILYPFVINDSLSFPDSIKITDKNYNPIKFNKTETDVLFPFKELDYFNGYYRQTTKHSYFEYILTSTQSWGKPLEEMDFIIKIHKNLELLDLSLSYNKIEKGGDFTTYYISRKNYMPKKNIVIKWKEK